MWMFSGGVKDYHHHVRINHNQLKNVDFKSLANLKREQGKLKSMMPVIACLEIDLTDYLSTGDGYVKNLIEFQTNDFKVLDVQKLVFNDPYQKDVRLWKNLFNKGLPES